MKVIFMGTPDFAVPVLDALVDMGCDVCLAVTQPDKPKGRHGALTASPVKEAALSHGIEVYQPSSLKNEEAVKKLEDLAPDFMVVAAFGQILTKRVLDIPKYCCVNIHASILPEYRGSSPIQRAIIDGKKITGVSAMRMDEGIDTGDVIMVREVAIDDNDTAETLFDKLSYEGGRLIKEALRAIEEGKATYTPQDESRASYTAMIKKSDGKMDFEKSAGELSCFVRGMSPWPCAFTYLKGKTLKIWETSAVDIIPKKPEAKDENGIIPGTIIVREGSRMFVSCGEGELEIKSLQLEGKKRMDAAAFLRGVRLDDGTRLGE